MKTNRVEYFKKELVSTAKDTVTQFSVYGDRQVERVTKISKWTGFPNSGIYAGKEYEDKTVWENGIIVYTHNKPWGQDVKK